MVEILAYKTAEEAKQQLKKYKLDNKKANEELVKQQGESFSERLKKQTYLFVAELGAYVDDEPEKFYFESVAFPFLGWNDLCNDIQSLVQGVKDTVRLQRRQRPNIETILYTVEDHNAKNMKFKKDAGESRKIAEENWSSDGTYGDERFDISKEWDKMLESLEDIENTDERGLTKQEREEFVKLYEIS